jgi:hypothetical protein
MGLIRFFSCNYFAGGVKTAGSINRRLHEAEKP